MNKLDNNKDWKISLEKFLAKAPKKASNIRIKEMHTIIDVPKNIAKKYIDNVNKFFEKYS